LNQKENNVIDSLSYQKTHDNAKGIQDEVLRFSNTLISNGYLSSFQKEYSKKNDSTFLYVFILNQRTKANVIHLDKIEESTKKLLGIEHNKVIIEIPQTQHYINSILQNLERKGYAISQIKLNNHQIINDSLHTDLSITLDKKRKIDLITIQPYQNFPSGVKKQMQRRYVKKDFNQETINLIQKELTQYPFIKTMRPAEVLFTEDNTILYLYLEKANVSRFDGIVGFTNDEEGNVRFNGNIDLNLINLFNKGEQFTIYWKNDGNQQSTFKFKTELPYLFKTPFGIQGDLQIFKQDSTQQNTQLGLTALYYLSYNNRLGVGYKSTSSVAGSGNLYGAENYSNRFVTVNYSYQKWKDHFLFRQQTNIMASAGYGNRIQESDKVKQQFVQIIGEHIFYLNNRNSVHLKTEWYHLFSKSVLYNELYRFGGINSIRGFSENSLMAKSLAGLYAEYRYSLSSTIYAHTITDFAHYREPLSKFKGNLYSFGIGVGLNTAGGLFNLVYANGIQPEQDFKLSNSIIHLSYKTQF